MKRLLIVLACLNCLFPAVQADGLGRLFSNAEERQRINDLRAGKQPMSEPQRQQTEQVRLVDQLILNGILTGSDGRRLAWINGREINADAPGSEVDLRYDGSAQLHWPGMEGSPTLKPGQGVDRASGTIFELYERDHSATMATTPADTGR